MKIRNNTKFNKSKGFTLIELLAVLGIVVTVGSVTAVIIISSLRATSKTNQTNLVRQNGNFALLQISRTIQYAKSFEGVSDDGINFTNDCTVSPPDTQPPNPTPQPSYYKSIRINQFDDTQITFACSPPDSPVTVTYSDGTTTTDLVDTSSIAVTSCFFTCSQTFKTESPNIGINLTLRQLGESDFAEKITEIPFSTSITMRNSNK